MDLTPTIAFADFEKIDIRAGRIVRAETFSEARKPAFKLWIDFGPLGTRTSSAQITRRYQPGDLIGRCVTAVVNFAPRQIGPFQSEVLTLGIDDGSGAVVLLVPDKDVPLGHRVF
jgi:tRNA-binding protein